MGMYWVRAVGTNDGGEGETQELDNYILATPPPGKKISIVIRRETTLKLKAQWL